MQSNTLPPKEEISATFEQLRELHDIVKRAGTKSVALGLLHHPMIETVDGGRSALQAFNAQLASQGVADTFINTADLLPNDSWRFSADRVHLQESCYSEFGNRLAQPLADAFKQWNMICT